MVKRMAILIVALLASLATLAPAQDRSPREERRAGRVGQEGPRRGKPEPTALRSEVKQLEALSIILGRPTDRSIAVNVLSAEPREGYVEYGLKPGDHTAKTDTVKLPAGTPVEMQVDGLDRDKRYFYRLQHRKIGDAAFTAGAEHGFHTQRAPGSTFTFEIQGDSHPERPHENDLALYAQTLRAAAADHPDFYVAMGDDFSVDTLRTVNAKTVAGRYSLQRPFLALVAQSSPLFLVNGNHEQAALCNLDGTANNVAVWAQTDRNKFFPQPAPDDFYTGDQTPVEHIRPLRDYYAWTWGDALFVVIDPYWHSPEAVNNALGERPATTPAERRAPRDVWAITLGDEQYKWLKKTLESSKTRYKFVFTHHVLGTGRGGIEQAALFEWGGKNRRGVSEFVPMRPGWEFPIHQLIAKNGVTIFFQGHDHIFARQKLDGVVYQTLPEPADPSYGFAKWASAYRSGDVLPNSGRVRVTVSPQKVCVEYLRSYLPKDATPEHPHGEVAFAYEIPASRTAATGAPGRDLSSGSGWDRTDTPSAQQGQARGPQGIFRTDVPEHPLDVILVRPTATSVMLTVLCCADAKAYMAYGTRKEDLALRTEVQELKKGVPQEVVVAKLKPDTRYYYQLRDAADRALTGSETMGTFHTQRRPGSAFVFTVQADSHLDENASPELYRRTLANALADAPDFHIDLGDTFMTDKHPSRDSAAKQYLAQRYHLGLVGQSAPVFLVVGNHDGEDGKLLKGGADSLAVWSNTMRKRYFPNPIPDSFYAGNITKDPLAGLLQDYYAWQWGDALFVVLDPYWHSSGRRGDDTWGMTLGSEQYNWLKKTLESSKAKFRFVFIHQLVGGLDKQGRGGSEAASFGEWGGKNADGTDGFKDHRPGWDVPIHPLLVRNHVTILFHGHDHLFAKQDLDGIVYQEVPQPGDPRGNTRTAAEYGHNSGTILGSSGHLRLTVSESRAMVEYVCAFLRKDEGEQRKNGQVGYVYEVPPVSR